MKILNIEINRETIVEFTKFVLVGLLNTAIALVIFKFLTGFLLINDILSNTISYIAGLINSFIWNRNWTFKKKDNKLIKYEMFLFIIFFLISFSIQMSVYSILKYKEIFKVHFTLLNILTITSIDVYYFIGMIFYTGSNFVFNKVLTFNKSNLKKFISVFNKILNRNKSK